jgi:WXG100 family type VII secretion target
MANGFNGDPAQFATAHSQVSDIKQQMDSQLASLRGSIEATQSSWQGKAAKAFQAVMESFDQKSAGLNTALQDIADLIQNSGVKYTQSEDDAQSHTSKIAAGLEGH